MVYIFNSAVAGNYTFDLCESGYDTKIWVWDIELNCVGCNEDYCSDSSGNPYRSYLEIQNLPAGDYYIIVDGYGGEAGEYRLITDMESPQEYGNCQLPHSSDDEWSAGTSYDDSDEHNYLRADRFGDTGLISSIRFWGLSLAYTSGWSECLNFPMDFHINIYSDEGLDYPGELAYSEDVSLTGTPVGTQYAGYILYEFNVSLQNPVLLEDGWLGLQGYGDFHDCWFLWLSSGTGDGYSYFEANGDPQTCNWDLSFCLNPDEAVMKTDSPINIALVDVYPNPFNPSTSIEYSLATPARVALSVYNINGQLVDVIHDGFMPAGHHTAAWSPSDLASGVYIVKLRVDTYAVTQKMMYIK